MAAMKFYNVTTVPTAASAEGTYYVKDGGGNVSSYLVSSGIVQYLGGDTKQTTGQDTNKAMSQKSVTDLVTNINNKAYKNVQPFLANLVNQSFYQTGSPKSAGWAGGLLIDDFSNPLYRDYYIFMTYSQGVVMRETRTTGEIVKRGDVIVTDGLTLTQQNTYSITNKLNCASWGLKQNVNDLLPLIYSARCSSSVSTSTQGIYVYRVTDANLLTNCSINVIQIIQYSGSQFYPGTTYDGIVDDTKQFIWIYSHSEASAAGKKKFLKFALPSTAGAVPETPTVLTDAMILDSVEFTTSNQYQDAFIKDNILYFGYGNSTDSGIAVVDLLTKKVLADIDITQMCSNLFDSHQAEIEGVYVSEGYLYFTINNSGTNSNLVNLNRLPVSSALLLSTDLLEIDRKIETLDSDTQDALNLKADLVGGLVPAEQLPSFVDDVIEIKTWSDSTPASPTSGDFWFAPTAKLLKKYVTSAWVTQTDLTGKIYIYYNVTTSKTEKYRWNNRMLSIENPLDYASQAEAEGNAENTKAMTALRVFQNFVKNISNYTVSALNTTSKTIIGAINELFTSTTANTTAIATKIDKASVKQVSGTSTTDIMSQKAVADNLDLKANLDVVDKVSSIEETIKPTNNDSRSLPLLCGQPTTLFGNGTPQEAIVPDNWIQFADGGYNWNGEPSAVGQRYINVASGGVEYIAIRSSYDKTNANYYTLIWKAL